MLIVIAHRINGSVNLYLSYFLPPDTKIKKGDYGKLKISRRKVEKHCSEQILMMKMKIMKIQFVLALAQRNKLFDFFFDITGAQFLKSLENIRLRIFSHK
jgi:hypothetical protein